MAMLAVLAAGANLAPAGSPFEDMPEPSIGLAIGGYFGSDRHSYMAESRLELPLARLDEFWAGYRQSQATPFLREGAQAELMHSRYEVEAGIRLGPSLCLLGLGGYRTVSAEDRPGSRHAGVIGAGFEMPAGADASGPELRIVGGGYLWPDGVADAWWVDVHAAWFLPRHSGADWLGTRVRPAFGLAADAELSGDASAVHSRLRIGPVVEFITAQGNTAWFQTAWCRVDGHPFYESDDTAWLVSMGLRSAMDAEAVGRARARNAAGWLPLIWGEYELGAGTDRTLQRTALDAEFHDFILAGRRFTGRLSYEARQEMRPGDYDNISYTGVVGLQSDLGWIPPGANGRPLVFGADYLHRSAHVLDPEAHRVPGTAPLARNSINLLPRLRLQTRGWDLPYRDPRAFDGGTRRLNDLEWRLTLGLDVGSSRERTGPAAQAGLRWDIASVRGFVIYAGGLLSAGNETPDWQTEVGVRRPSVRIAFRAERYGLESHLARGDTFVLVAGLLF
ncbi:MAG: hypothetical protein BWK77_03560 [Verrucomicrobia bacterium A1]|nr:MAG: hypothetical protein BWK77_03560 [Verrucomicrobia bacterium A1]